MNLLWEVTVDFMMEGQGPLHKTGTNSGKSKWLPGKSCLGRSLGKSDFLEGRSPAGMSDYPGYLPWANIPDIPLELATICQALGFKTEEDAAQNCPVGLSVETVGLDLLKSDRS